MPADRGGAVKSWGTKIAILASVMSLIVPWAEAAKNPRLGGGVVTGGYYEPCSPDSFEDNSRLRLDFIGRMPVGHTSYQMIGRLSGVTTFGDCEGKNFLLHIEGMNATGKSLGSYVYCLKRTTLQPGMEEPISVQPTMRFEGICYPPSGGDVDPTPPAPFMLSIVVQPGGRDETESGKSRYSPLVGAYTVTPAS